MKSEIQNLEQITGHFPISRSDESQVLAEMANDLGSRYELKRYLGRGGFATVWEAFDRIEQLPVAIKKLNPNPSRSGDFFREMRAMFRLNHPNIVRLWNFLETAKNRYLILEFCGGESLRTAISLHRNTKKKWPLNRIHDVISQLASGLNIAHAAGITHRDIKPENVLFSISKENQSSESSIAKLADFGLATVRHPQDDGRLRAVTGSPAYMAPEQFAGTFTQQSDIYALGIVAYEMLTREVPFQGMPGELAYQHLNHQPVFPSDMSGPLKIILPKMLSKKIEDRPAAMEVVNVLKIDQSHRTRNKNIQLQGLNEKIKERSLKLCESFPCDATSILATDQGFLANNSNRQYEFENGKFNVRKVTSSSAICANASDRIATYQNGQLSISSKNGQTIWQRNFDVGSMPARLAIMRNGTIAVAAFHTRPEVAFISHDGSEESRVEVSGIISSVVPMGDGVAVRVLTGKGFRAYQLNPNKSPIKLSLSDGLNAIASNGNTAFGAWPDGRIVQWDTNKIAHSFRIDLQGETIRGIAVNQTNIAVLTNGSKPHLRIALRPNPCSGGDR